MLRLLLIVSAVSTVMIGCNFTMEPDPGATGFDEANAFDAMVGRAVDATELGGGGQAGPDSADMHTAPPQTPEDLGDTGSAVQSCHDAGVESDAGASDAGLTDGAVSDAGPTCDMFVSCGDAGTDDSGACTPAQDGGGDGG